ncbi:MAG: AtpZ/AtpI family protein [Pseudomonadota bacterium]
MRPRERAIAFTGVASPGKVGKSTTEGAQMAEDDGGRRSKAPKRRDDLGSRIEQARKGAEPEPSGPSEGHALSVAWRMTLDLVIATTVGFGMGWGFDSLLGTAPLLMIVFGLIGFAAGVKMVLRAAKSLQKD